MFEGVECLMEEKKGKREDAETVFGWASIVWGNSFDSKLANSIQQNKISIVSQSQLFQKAVGNTLPTSFLPQISSARYSRLNSSLTGHSCPSRAPWTAFTWLLKRSIYVPVSLHRDLLRAGISLNYHCISWPWSFAPNTGDDQSMLVEANWTEHSLYY